MTATAELAEAIRSRWAGHRTPVLRGNLGDLHVAPDGAVMAFDQLVAVVAAADDLSTIRWSPGRGTAQETPPGRASIHFSGPAANTDVAVAVARLVAELERTVEPVCLVFDWVDAGLARTNEPLGPAFELLTTAASDPTLLRAGHRFVIVDRSGQMTATLTTQQVMSSVDVALPDRDERASFIARLTATGGDSFAPLDADLTIERIADATNGLSLRRILALGGELARVDQPLTLDAVVPIKRDFLIERTDGALRPLSSVYTFDQLAGLPNVRVYVDDLQHGLGRHLIVAGPPGTGKTSLISALASALGVSAIELGDVRMSYVGESERRMRTALAMATSMAPCVLAIDEIDRVLGGDSGPSGDSGVTQRINAMFRSWIGDVESAPGVIVVASTNRPGNLGRPERDRFTTIPVLHPDPSEAAVIVALAAERRSRAVELSATSELFAERRRLYSGRTLVEVVGHAILLADRQAGSTVERLRVDHLQAALDQVLMWGDDAVEEYMTLDAIQATEVRKYLPWEAASLLGEPYTPPSYVSSLMNASGGIDAAALADRMAQLRRVQRVA